MGWSTIRPRSSFPSFLWGVGTTLVVVWMVQTIQERKRQRNRRKQQESSTDHDKSSSSTLTSVVPPPSSSSNTPSCFDAPDLDQRMIRKAEGTIQLRCSRITVVVERCTNDYNYSAILRTVEALGLQHVWIIEPPPPSYKIAARKTTSNGEEEEEHGEDDGEDEEETDGKDEEHEDEPDITQLEDQQEPFRSPGTGKLIKTTSGKERRDRALHHLFARRAMEWLSVREFATTQECLEELRNTHHVVWATDLSQQAVCLTHDALQEYYDTHQQQRQQQQGTNNHHTLSSSSLVPKQLAIVFGTEAVGCSAEMLEAADLRVYLPLRGFADSLNLSVATALVLHQLFCLDPTLIGSMPESERRSLRQAWFAKLCRQRLLTPSQKRQRYKLLHKIKICHDVQHQQQHGHFLHKEQLAKLDRLPALQQELAKLDQRNHLIETAIADLVDHPPAALTDMRRADDHRVCYVGKNTKRRHETDWQDMPATSNIHTLHNSTATFFRQRVRELDLRQPQDQEIH